MGFAAIQHVTQNASPADMLNQPQSQMVIALPFFQGQTLLVSVDFTPVMERATAKHPVPIILIVIPFFKASVTPLVDSVRPPI